MHIPSLTTSSETLYRPPPINFQINTLNPIHQHQLRTKNHRQTHRDKPPLIARQIQRRIRHVHRIRQPPQRHIRQKLVPILRRIRHAGEHLEQPCAREQRADAVHADLVGAVFGGEAFGGLSRRVFQLGQ